MTGFNGTQRHFAFSATDNARILELWNAGNDTLDIARALCVPESAVANQLPVLLAAKRQEAEWKAAE